MQPYKFLLIGTISCSMLMYEILLIRVTALRLAFHFGFLVISNCLLAIGASGTLITLQQARLRDRPRFWLGFFSVGYLAALAAVYTFLCIYPVSSTVAGNLTLSHPAELLHFTVYNLVTAVPFFFGGTVVGMLLTFNPETVNRLYFVDLLGAGLGCLLATKALSTYGGGGCMVALWLVALVGVWPLAQGRRPGLTRVLIAALLLLGIVLMPRLEALFPVRGRYIVELSKYLQVNRAPDLIGYTKWTATSRIDMVYVKKRSEVIYGLGSKRDRFPPLPEESAIVQDASAGTVMINFSDHPEALEIVRASTYSASMRLKKNARVFIIGVGGANDVWAAYAAGAGHVKAVELNAPIIDIHKRILPRFSRTLVNNPDIHLVVDEGRAALMRDRETYDVIQLTGVDTWTGLKSGAYVLAENYLYTTEAIATMFEHLAEGGIVQFIRMAEDMEVLRMVTNFYTAFPPGAPAKFEDAIMIMKTPDSMATVMVKPSGFTPAEKRSTRAFQRKNGITPVYTPGDNHGNIVEQYIVSESKAAFIAAFERDISPTTDDRPYFFNYHRWSDVWGSRRFAGEVSSVSQGNPFFLVAQLMLSALFSLAFIVVPLFGRTTIERRGATRFLAYFAGVGLGFIMIEVSMLQKLTVFLGHPVYSITVTLASMLFFAGIGSLLSARWFDASPSKSWLVPVALAAVMAVFLLGWPHGMASLITLPLAVRIVVAGMVIAPVAFLLGVPFAYGLRVLNRYNSTLVPWAWAVNGCFSVAGSILTAIVSMVEGFSFAMMAAVGAYLLAFAALNSIDYAAHPER